MTTTRAITRLDHDECLRLLETDEVGRLAIVVGGAPHVIPVNYAMDGESIVFRTDEGTKLHAAERAPACFEVDSFDRDLGSGWSVVAHGNLFEVTRYDGRVLTRLSTVRLVPWAPGEKAHWMRLIARYFTGRRLTA